MISKEVLFKGSAIEIKDVRYKTTKEYLEKAFEFMEKFSDDYIIRIKSPEYKVYDDEGNPTIGFTKVNVEWTIKSEEPEGYKKVLVLCYALDVKTPIAKIYIGYRNKEGHLIVPDADAYFIQNLEEGDSIQLTHIVGLLGRTSHIEKYDSQLDKSMKTEELSKILGNWITACDANVIDEESFKVKLSSSQPLKAFKNLMVDQKSNSYIIGDETDLFTVLNEHLKLITDDEKDIITEFEKTVLVNRMLGL